MWVRDVMSSPVVTVSPQTSVRTALRLLDEHKVTSLPVVDVYGRVIGVVSEADLVRESVLPDQRRRIMWQEMTERPPARIVEDVMTGHPVTADAGDDLAAVVELLTTTTVKSVPVLDRGHLVGMLSRRDVVHLLARDDERIEAEVSELFRADGVDWMADVCDGVVTVSGPGDPGERRLAQALAGSVAGVVGIRVE
ncbi:MAG: CBS domain-containing protein [Nocardioides sp.]